MAIVGIDHVQLAMPAGREDVARRFYSGLLEIPERPKPAELAKRGGVWFENDAVKVHLGVEAEFRRPERRIRHYSSMISESWSLDFVVPVSKCSTTKCRGTTASMSPILSGTGWS